MDRLTAALVTWLASLPPWASLAVMTGVIVGTALLGVWLLRRMTAHETMRRHHDVAGFVFAAVGVIYAVLLAFTVLMAFEHHRDTEAATASEAGSLKAMVDLLGTTDSEQARATSDAIADYARLVVQEELSGSSRGESTPQTREAFTAIWVTAAEVEMPTVAGGAELLAQLGSADVSRTERVQGADGAIPTSVWVVLALGAVVTIGFSLLFSVEAYPAHVLVVGGLAALIAFVLFVDIQLNYPFVGVEAIDAEPFTRLAG